MQRSISVSMSDLSFMITGERKVALFIVEVCMAKAAKDPVVPDGIPAASVNAVSDPVFPLLCY